MSDPKERLLELAKKIELRELVTTGMFARRTAGEPGPVSAEPVDLNIGIQVGVVRQADSFVGVVAVSVRVRRKTAKRHYARFVHRVNVHYAGHGDASDEELLDFMNTNGMVHVWPYARAFVQSASASLGIPPVLLPVFRVQAPNGRPLQKRVAGTKK